MTKLDSILKSRDIILLTKIHIVKVMVFPVVIYGCESRPIKKAECQRIDAFELWCWRRLLRAPWTARWSSQSILKEINQSCIFIGVTDAEPEVLILQLPEINWLITKDADAGKDWRQEEKVTTEDEVVEWHHRLDGHEFEQAPRVGDGLVGLAWAVHGVSKSWTELSDWTDWLMENVQTLLNDILSSLYSK